MAAQKLAEEGVSARVIDMHTIKPLDQEAVLSAARETGRIITVEDHNIKGGLGSAVAECLIENGLAPRFKRMGIPDVFVENGGLLDLHKHYGFDEEGLYKAAKEMLQG